MDGIFSGERGKLLFEEAETDLFFPAARSKSSEHSSYERSKSAFSEKNENSQKSKKNEENRS